jgi:hypothetical protein
VAWLSNLTPQVLMDQSMAQIKRQQGNRFIWFLWHTLTTTMHFWKVHINVQLDTNCSFCRTLCAKLRPHIPPMSRNTTYMGLGNYYLEQDSFNAQSFWHVEMHEFKALWTWNKNYLGNSTCFCLVGIYLGASHCFPFGYNEMTSYLTFFVAT